MNNIFYLFCVLHIASSCAMQGVLATVFAAAPIVAPGAYYYCKTAKQMKEIENNTTESGAKMQSDYFRPFISGAVHGVVPPSNVIQAIGEGPVNLFNNLKSWEKYESTILDNDREKARLIGFMSGLSLYATVPLALRYARR